MIWKLLLFLVLINGTFSLKRQIKCGFDPEKDWVRIAAIRVEPLENDQLRLECEMHGSYGLTVKWYSNNELIRAHISTRRVSEYDVEKDFTNYSTKVQLIGNKTDFFNKSLFCVGQSSNIVCQIPFYLNLSINENHPTVVKLAEHELNY